MDTNKTCAFTAAFRGFHVYMRHCQPVENEELVCYQEAENSYDIFAVKVCQQRNDATIGHLPMESSRIMKYILQRDDQVKAILIATHYRRSPLAQGRLQIPCYHARDCAKPYVTGKIYTTCRRIILRIEGGTNSCVFFCTNLLLNLVTKGHSNKQGF